MEPIIENYDNYLEKRNLADSTRSVYLKGARKFLKTFPRLSERQETIREYVDNSSGRGRISLFVSFLLDRGLLNWDKYQNEDALSADGALKKYARYLTLQDHTPRTTASITSQIRIFLSFLAESRIGSLHEVSRQVMGSFLNYLYGREKQKNVPYSLSYKAKVISSVSRFFVFLQKESLLLSNPAAHLKPPKVPKTTVQNMLTLAEVDRLLKNIDEKKERRDYLLIEFIYNTGCRVNEAANARVKDIDLGENIFHIRSGKGKKDRVVPFSPKLSKQLAPYIKGKKKEACLFPNQYGHRLAGESVTRMICRRAKAAGIYKHVTAITLRHTCATHLMQNGAGIRHIQLLLGHENINTTQVYTKVVLTDLRKAIGRYHPMEIK